MKIVKMPSDSQPGGEVNTQIKMTRRVPTFRSPAQERRDAEIARTIAMMWDVEHNAEGVLNYFVRHCSKLSNPIYWEILRTVWVIAGTTDSANRFRPLFRSSRPAKGWFMTMEDAAFLSSMPDVFKVYRAVDPKFNLYEDDGIVETFGIPESEIDNGDIEDTGISWTINLEWVTEYARHRHKIIKSMMVEKSKVFAYISRRGEDEILIL